MSYVKSDHRIAKKRLAIRSKRGDVNFEIYPKKTNQHFYLVVYNCAEKREVFCYSTLKIKDAKNNIEGAQKVGAEVAAWCLANNVPSVYFNKLNYKFHGKLESALNSFNEKFNK